MRGILLGVLLTAATVLAPPAWAAPKAATGEQFVKVAQLVVRFETSTAYLRLLVVKLNLAIPAEHAAAARADRARIEETLQQALAAVSYDDYASGNLASRVKSVARTALRRAKLTYIGDVLVQEVRLI